MILQELVTHSIKPLLPLGLVFGAAAFAAGDRLWSEGTASARRTTLADDGGGHCSMVTKRSYCPRRSLGTTPFIGIGQGCLTMQNYVMIAGISFIAAPEAKDRASY